ncbi:MAG: polysaccharide biosynthesis C-terminal domain-containing protein [Ruminococcus sp.]|nr:polysaccharide biosynthesis C-terminal domain-containing protein [Ruminococcus sp.]
MSDTKPQSSYNKLLANTIVFAIGQFSSKVLVLLLVPIYTNHLTKSQMGIADILTQIANWIIPLATMTISEAIIRFGLDKAYDKRQVFTIGNLVCGGGMLLFSLLLFLVNLSGIAKAYIGGYAVLLFAYVMMSGIKTLYTTFVRSMEKVKLFAVAGMVATFFTLFFMVMFYIVLPDSFLGEGTGVQKYLLATILSDLITTVFVTFAAKLWRYFDFRRLDREMMASMLQYSLPLIPAQLLWLITNSSDSFMTKHYMGDSANGVLSAAYRIPNMVATVYMMFGQAWNMSAITENDSKDRDRFYENVFDFNQSLLYILAGGCMLIIQPMTYMGFIGSDFWECIRYAPIIIYSTIFSCFTTFMGAIYLATKQTARSLATSLVSGVINVGLNIILIPTIGLYGPPISTVASYVTVFILRVIDSKKIVPFKINYKKMVTSNIILLGMLAILLLETDLLHHLPLYLLLFVLFCGVFIINMESISSLLFRFLPKSIAEKIVSLGKARLAAAALLLAVFLALNVKFRFLPLMAVLIAGVICSLLFKKQLPALICGGLLAVSIGAVFSWIYCFLTLCALSLSMMTVFMRYRYIAALILSFDGLLGAWIDPWLGAFLFLGELIAVFFVFSGRIGTFAAGYAKTGDLIGSAKNALGRPKKRSRRG